MATAPTSLDPRPGLRLDWRLDRLRPLLPGVELQALASAGSTNTTLLDRLRTGDGTPVLLVAEDQTSGRGRNGRSWRSAPGCSLTFSFARRLAPADWSGLSLAVGAALADAIEPDARVPRLQLKWPNDLWLADGGGRWRKLGGILVETVAVAGGRGVVVGVGLNVLPLADTSGLASGHACVHELHPGIDAPALLERVAAPLVAALARFERDGLAAFAGAYARRDLLRGLVVATTGEPPIEGIAEGVDDQGLLIVRGANGPQRVSSGEVSVRPLPARPLGA